ncbi:MAG TPA: colicin immunity domain-containing protein [Steroidobacteraceae bacterium]|jgi:hypothetical protein|nr:colicin immunity domain-containing protein [Steroidobacteraceae bacterium]
MNELISERLAYLALINAYLSQKLAARHFQSEFLKMWKRSRDLGTLSALNSESNEAFDRIFTAVDSYCEDPALKDHNDLTDSQLRSVVTELLSSIGDEAS